LEQPLKHLSALARLTELDLNGTKVTAAGVEELQKALPNLAIRGIKGKQAPKQGKVKDATPAQPKDQPPAQNATITIPSPGDMISCVAFSPAGKLLASCEITSGPPGSRRGDRTVALWDALTGKEVVSLKVPSGTVSSLAFSPDGKRLAFVEGITGKNLNGTVVVWDVVSADGAVKLNQVFRKEHDNCVNCVVFSPDSKHLAFGYGPVRGADGGKKPGVTLLEAGTGKAILTLEGHTDGIRGLAFSADGRLLASASQDNTLKLWVMDSGKERLTFTGHTARLYSVAFSPDGKTLASGSMDKTIKLWDVAGGREIRTLAGQGGDVRSVTFSPDGKQLASAGTGGFVKLWDVASGREIADFKGHKGSVQYVAFSPDGSRLATAGLSDATIKLWDVPRD
jgi:WD40 repeat protein